MILLYQTPFHSLSIRLVASKITLDQTFGRNALIAGDAIPWLRDLDATECHLKDRRGSWDWKQLARLLHRAQIFDRALQHSLAVSGDDDDDDKRRKRSSEDAHRERARFRRPHERCTAGTEE